MYKLKLSPLIQDYISVSTASNRRNKYDTWHMQLQIFMYDAYIVTNVLIANTKSRVINVHGKFIRFF